MTARSRTRRTEEAVERLPEDRTTLIAAAVTSKIDARKTER